MSIRDYFWVLEKVSVPGWERHFESRDECLEALREHVCGECMKGEPLFDAAGETGEYVDPPAPNSMQDLLKTSCGYEFEVTEPTKWEC